MTATATPAFETGNLRAIDWIWHVEGSVPLAPAQSSDEAFDRLDPLFRTTGTTHERSGDTLTFQKRAPAAQDKMSIYDGGVLQIEEGAGGRVLRYRLISKALLLCFLAPLFFLGMAGLTITIGKFDKPPTAAEEAAKKKAMAAKAAIPQSPIDKALGAPAPDKPKKDADKKDGDKKDKDKDRKRSPTPAYVFAGIFAALYIIGRILEPWLIKRAFTRRLLE